jgi:phosphoserine phosphatase RsbU/P
MEIWGGNCAADTGVSTPGLDLWVYSRPHEQAACGGDVHYVSLCASGAITRLILADISGHGASLDQLARSLRDLMRRNINRASQEQLIRALNRQFATLVQLNHFATAVVVTYLTGRDTLTVSNAGHPRPMWLRADSGEWTVLSHEEATGGLPLGIDALTPYSDVQITLSKGDLALLYTDALIESTDPSGKALGEAGLLELVRKLDPKVPRAFPAALTSSLDRWRNGKPAADDLTFLFLHHRGGEDFSSRTNKPQEPCAWPDQPATTRHACGAIPASPDSASTTGENLYVSGGLR